MRERGKRIVMLPVDDDSFALLLSGALGLRLTRIEHGSGGVRDQGRVGELVDETLEPRNERVAVIDRAGVNHHVELRQVRFSGGGKEADDIGTECGAGENPGEELDDPGATGAL